MFYSRDEIITAITKYYTFLSRLNQPPEALRLPPPGGWPSTPDDALRTHGRRNDDVIDLIKHLPYFRLHGVEPQILPETSCVQYPDLPPEREEDVQRGRLEGSTDPILAHDEALGPDCICIAYGRRHAWSLVLDLTHGTVIWYSNDGEWEDEDYDLGDVLPADSTRRVLDGSEWREQPTYDIKYFFGEFCRKRINDLNWLPHLDGEIRSIHPQRDVHEEDVIRRQILVDAGFPGDGFGGGFDRDRWFNDERHDEL